ncbi:hypothetical protein J1614_003384 [Plenodomus biglobosus]|nr:hypothetical protein J1614_003384 [Plenodomus biglobosus]
MSGLVFFGTPHEGIHNEDWVDVWGDEPPNTLIRDLSPGSSLLRDLRESFEQHSREEKFFTVYELQETRTVQKIAGGKLDRNGEPVLRIDEKAACINSANETRMGVNEDHSKIAKLHNGDGSPYHFIKTHIQEVADHARIITTTRMRRKFILCVLLGLRAYFTHVFRSVSSPSVLLLAEYSDINAICDILEEPNILEEPDNSLLHLALPTASVRIASQAAENLKSLFYNNITEASFLHGTLRKRLNNDTGSFWLAAEEQTNHGLAIPPVCTEDLVNAAVPLIIELKESIATALPLQNKSLLKAFIESEQAKHLGLHLVVRRRELWNQLGIPAIPPTDGILTDVLQQKGLSIGTFYANDGPEAHLVIVERRSYKTLGAGMPSQKERKAVSKELAAILRDASFSSLENKSMRRLLSPVMSIFEFEGYIDDLESKEHIFMYRVPTQPGISSREMISRSMSLDFWIGDTGDGPPRLEERYAVAYHLCHTVFNQHVSGWVHKSLRPANVILIPNSTRDSEFLQIGRGYTQKPYLKGFELSRKVATPSLRIPEVDSDADVYVHPDRRGKRIITEFHPVHDMYALGVLLIEIGTGLPILESIRQLKCPSASRIYEDDTKRVAKEKLPGNLGTRYAECAIRCLEGYHGFQVHHRYRDNTDLITAFRMLVVDELKRMAVAGGYSFEG